MKMIEIISVGLLPQITQKNCLKAMGGCYRKYRSPGITNYIRRILFPSVRPDAIRHNTIKDLH